MQNRSILIVEDDHIIALDIESRLKRLGYSTLGPVSSGEQAIETSRLQHPDLALMDIKLKGKIDGIEAAQEIRSELDIPIVYLTAYADRQTLDRAKITRPFGYILKPFDGRDLSIALEMAFYAHEMESAVRLNEQRFRSLFESSQDAIVVTDRLGTISLANHHAEALFGFLRSELLNVDLPSLFGPQSKKTLRDALNDLMAPGSRLKAGRLLELTALRGALESTDRARGSAPSVSTGSRSGSNFPVELSLSAACEKSEIFVLAIIRDISERKRNENALHQALEKSRVASQAKSEFLTNMTHELFTPMNSILGMTELALASELNQEQKQYLDIIKFSGDSLLYMLHSILDTMIVIL